MKRIKYEEPKGKDVNNKDIKELRKQLRFLVKELLPEVLASEVHTFALAQIDRATKETLKRMEERHKDTLGMLVRTASSK